MRLCSHSIQKSGVRCMTTEYAANSKKKLATCSCLRDSRYGIFYNCEKSKVANKSSTVSARRMQVTVPSSCQSNSAERNFPL